MKILGYLHVLKVGQQKKPIELGWMSKTNWGWLEKYERRLPSEQKKSNASDDFNGNWWNDSACCYVSWCVVHGYYSRYVFLLSLYMNSMMPSISSVFVNWTVILISFLNLFIYLTQSWIHLFNEFDKQLIHIILAGKWILLLYLFQWIHVFA